MELVKISNKIPLLGIDLGLFADELVRLGFQSYRAKQVMQHVYSGKCLDFNSMLNVPKKLREFLSSNYSILTVKPVKKESSKSGETDKLLLELVDGNKIECVIIRSFNRNTLCISSQVGCALDCKFCSTGGMGFIRNLTHDEILSQFLYACSVAGSIDNVVFMGMGEPLLNYDNIIKSIKILNCEKCFNFGVRRVTLSTSGIISGINKLLKDAIRVKLAVSLNSAISEKRTTLMPVNKTNNLDKLTKTLEEYQNKTKKRVTFEYVMIKNFNISKEDAHAIIGMSTKLNFNLNLIPYNYTKNQMNFETPSKGEVEKFVTYFENSEIEIVKRYKKGDDISAACGQLATDKVDQGVIKRNSLP